MPLQRSGRKVNFVRKGGGYVWHSSASQSTTVFFAKYYLCTVHTLCYNKTILGSRQPVFWFNCMIQYIMYSQLFWSILTRKTCPICHPLTIPRQGQERKFHFHNLSSAGGREEGKYFLTSQRRGESLRSCKERDLLHIRDLWQSEHLGKEKKASKQFWRRKGRK